MRALQQLFNVSLWRDQLNIKLYSAREAHLKSGDLNLQRITELNARLNNDGKLVESFRRISQFVKYY